MRKLYSHSKYHTRIYTDFSGAWTTLNSQLRIRVWDYICQEYDQD